MRLSALTWPFPFLVRLGWATAGVPNPNPAQAVGHAFLLRGNGAVFSRGFGRICGALRRAGFWAEDLRCVGDRWLCRHLIREHRAGRLRGPVIFVGHSCGGRYALFASRRLEQLGVAVDLLICVDVAWPYHVSGNVRRAIHLYRTRQRLYPARPLRPAPGSAAAIENLDLDRPDSPLASCGLHHLNITAAQAIQGYIIERVLGTVVASSPGRCNTPIGVAPAEPISPADRPRD
jgi:Thioesterase domain